MTAKPTGTMDAGADTQHPTQWQNDESSMDEILRRQESRNVLRPARTRFRPGHLSSTDKNVR